MLGSAPAAIVQADFNGDGLADLATSHPTTGAVSLLLGSGGGVFSAPTSVAEGSGPAALAVANLDGLGGLDLVVANEVSGDLSILLGSDGLPDDGYGDCVNALDPDTTDTIFVDASIPLPGEGLFYLMARVDASGERDLGLTSAGQPRAPATPCP